MVHVSAKMSDGGIVVVEAESEEDAKHIVEAAGPSGLDNGELEVYSGFDDPQVSSIEIGNVLSLRTNPDVMLHGGTRKAK
ncbi:hypothetical protein [Candidatus Terasakiella magnetica]|nr:hypothetical protein [Candidatus Terasakiella magnetica]